MTSPYFERDGIVLYHGDARELLPALAYDVLVTDPPYGIDFAGQPTLWQRRKGAAREAWDERPFPELEELLLRGDKPAAIWGGNHYRLPPSRGWLVWYKPDAPPSMSQVELAWTNQDRLAELLTQTISATNAERVGHPTQKPLAVMLWTLRAMPEGVVCDPFAGSGTTLVAARDLGRRAIGVEIEERYCELAARRLDQRLLPFELEEARVCPVCRGARFVDIPGSGGPETAGLPYQRPCEACSEEPR